MSPNKAASRPSGRERVLDAAERLLARGGAGFSMRDLAEEAGVSFATPFNQFGAKGAIMALTRSASQEWGQYGIVTNTILPVVRTEPYDWSPQASEKADILAESITVRRFGAPYEDCSPVLAFLASEGAGYLNGQALAVDGGRILIA